MTKTGNEEKYPLLLLYVEENGRKSEFPQRVVFADKGRGKGVIRGAAAVITEWPAQVTSCWLTSIALGAGFIFISLLLLLSSLNPLSFPIHPRCARDVDEITANKTIHLVKFGNNWNHKQLDILRFIAESYPDFKIKNILLDNSLKNFRKREVKKEIATTSTEKNHFYFMPVLTNTVMNKLSEKLIKEAEKESSTVKENKNLSKREKRSLGFKFDSYENILKEYPNIKEEISTYKDYFTSTPLHYFWVDLSPEMMLFSVRVLEMWQHGGISFYLPVHEHHHLGIDVLQNFNTTVPLNKTNRYIPKDNFDMTRLKTLILNTKNRYEKLGEDLVSVDGQGLHMATKTPCHSFFGEMIIKLQKDEFKTVPEFIQRMLGVFCGLGAVDSDYCIKNKK